MTARGKAPKDDKWKAKYVEPVAPDTSDLPELPEGWCWSSLGELFEIRVGATPSRSKPEYWGGGVPWVSSGEVSFCRIGQTRETISATGLRNSSAQLNPAGSVLLGMIGEGRTRGQAAILTCPACNNQNSAAIWVSEAGLPPEYVYYFLMEQYEVTRTRGSGNNQPALNKSRVQGIPIPLPPLAEANRIVVHIEEHESVIESLAADSRLSISRLARLRQSILKWAFDGRLVDQDPTDEPASVLLERIRAERDAAGSDTFVRQRSKASKRQDRDSEATDDLGPHP
jgi:type I restriction enzyme S subunit